MGIFSDTCHALVGANGRHLQGEELATARQNSKAVRCGARVKRAAKFCSKCGSQAPLGWWECPQCGKAVGNESDFCWSCGKGLHPDRRGGMDGGVWQRTEGVLAERFEMGDLLGLLKKGLIIEPGTAALLLDGGAFKDVLTPGSYNLESLARRINHWGSPPPRTVVLVDSGDVVLPLRVGSLRTADDFLVEWYTEVAVRFDDKRAEEFLANLIKGRERFTVEDLIGVLARGIVGAVTNMCNTTTMEDLMKDPQRRIRFEDELKSELEKTLTAIGMKVIRIPSVEFTGVEYEKLRAKSEELEVRRRQYEFDLRLRDMFSADKMHELKTEHEMVEYVHQLAQEKAISSEQRDMEIKRVQMVNNHELTREAAAFEMEQRMIAQAEALKEIQFKLDAQRLVTDEGHATQIQEAQTQVKVQGIHADEEFRLHDEQVKRELDEADQWLDIKAKKERLHRENLKETADLLEGRDIRTLIQLTEDPDKRTALMELEKQMQSHGLELAKLTHLKGADFKTVLAMKAAESPELAHALTEMLRSENQNHDQEWEERKKMQADQMAQIERLFNKAMETTSDAAKQGPTTIVK